MDRVIVVGAGGFGREVMLYVRDSKDLDVSFEVGGYLDDNPAALDGLNDSDRVISSIESFRPEPNDRLIIGVGDPALRRQLTVSLSQRGARFCNVLHPLSWVAPTAELGEGCILGPFTFVGPGARLGNHVVLNCYASVGHDAHVEQFTVLSPYAVVNGAVSLGEEVFLGTHATVVAGKSVGAHSKLSAGSVALRSVPEGSLVAGNPGKSRVMFRKSRGQ